MEPQEKSKEEILKTPINQLDLKIENSILEPVIKKLYEELGNLGIHFRPATYLSDSWGCPDNVPVIGIPFYLANQKLWDIEKEKTTPYRERIESTHDPEEIAQILRHEAGHAFNYAYSLHKLPKFEEVFGVYNKPYNDNFAPIAGSDKFVRHLEGWYAQKHPDEDFAETFALLITPNFDSKKTYKGTPAYNKLLYVLELIKDYKDKPVPAFKSSLDIPIESLGVTLEEWYKKRIEELKSNPKILILFYQEYQQKRPMRDVVIDQIKEVLLKFNYPVVLLPINQSIERIINGIKEEKPDLIFNLCETFRNNDKFQFNVTALLEMMGIPFTGSSSGSLFLNHDKYLSKKIFDFHKVPHPNCFLVPIGTEPEISKNMGFPLFVKPTHEDASIGIDANSITRDETSLKSKVLEIHHSIKDDALVEEYIEGREFFVPILGNNTIRGLPIIELDFSNWPKDKPKIYTHEAKVEVNSPEYKALKNRVAEDLSGELQTKIQDVVLKAYRALHGQDYARADLRIDQNGKIYLLEINLNPYLGNDSETAFAAKASGIEYDELIIKIIELALARSKK